MNVDYCSHSLRIIGNIVIMNSCVGDNNVGGFNEKWKDGVKRSFNQGRE